MGFWSRLFGREKAMAEPEEGLRPVPGSIAISDGDGKVVHNMLDPMMGQFMGRCTGAVKKAGIKAKGTGQFSIALGDGDGLELPLYPLWEQYQQSQDQQVFGTAVELAQRMTTGAPTQPLSNCTHTSSPRTTSRAWKPSPPASLSPSGMASMSGLSSVSKTWCRALRKPTYSVWN